MIQYLKSLWANLVPSPPAPFAVKWDTERAKARLVNFSSRNHASNLVVAKNVPNASRSTPAYLNSAKVELPGATWVDTNSAARAAGVSAITIGNWAREGKIPSRRVPHWGRHGFKYLVACQWAVSYAAQSEERIAKAHSTERRERDGTAIIPMHTEMTAQQRRRARLWNAGLTLSEIGKLEGTSKQAVSQSLARSAERMNS